jgi:hypothetical protein
MQYPSLHFILAKVYHISAKKNKGARRAFPIPPEIFLKRALRACAFADERV